MVKKGAPFNIVFFSADIDEYVQSMLASAGELSCISSAGTSSMKKKNNDKKLNDSSDVSEQLTSSEKQSDAGSNIIDSSGSPSPISQRPCYVSIDCF